MGARTCSELAGSRPHCSRYWRRPPRYSVRITSFTVATPLPRRRVITAAGLSKVRRCGCARRVPSEGLGAGLSRTRAVPCLPTARHGRGRRPETNRATRSGSAARWRAARRVKAAGEGSGCGAGRGRGYWGPGPGVALEMRSDSPAPLASSIMAWCSLSMKAVAGCGSSARRMPSMTRPRHSGRSVGSRSPGNSANSPRAS